MNLIKRLSLGRIMDKTKLGYKIIVGDITDSKSPVIISSRYYCGCEIHSLAVGDFALLSWENNSIVYAITDKVNEKVRVKNIGKIHYNKILSDYREKQKKGMAPLESLDPEGSAINFELNRRLK